MRRPRCSSYVFVLMPMSALFFGCSASSEPTSTFGPDAAQDGAVRGGGFDDAGSDASRASDAPPAGRSNDAAPADGGSSDDPDTGPSGSGSCTGKLWGACASGYSCDTGLACVFDSAGDYIC